jgi:hypothetical protein
MIKRVLKSIFSMCKTIATETNENRRDIIEIKSHIGLPADPYHELPEFDVQEEEAEEGNDEEEEDDDDSE